MSTNVADSERYETSLVSARRDGTNRLRWIWLTPIAFFGLRILGNQLGESAVDQRDAPQTFASELLANPEPFSFGMYLAGLSGLAFLWFAWALWDRLRQPGPTGPPAAVAFGCAVLWSSLLVAAAALAATAPVLADYYDDAEGARFVANLEWAGAPLALTLYGAFALGNGLALRRASLVAPWLAWAGAALGGLLVVTAALQPIVEPTFSRSEEEVSSIVSFLTGFTSFGLVPLWTISVGLALFRRDGRMERWVPASEGVGDADRPL